MKRSEFFYYSSYAIGAKIVYPITSFPDATTFAQLLSVALAYGFSVFAVSATDEAKLYFVTTSA